VQRSVAQSAQPNFNLRDIGNLPIPALPVPEQQAIAHVLGTLDDKIELNRKMNETLEAMARALFKSWFVDFNPVRAKSEGRETGLPAHIADLFPDSFEDSELGEIPKGWKVGSIGDVAQNPRRGVQPGRMDPETPYIGLEHMPRRCIALSGWGSAENLESNKSGFRRGEILFGKLRPYFHKVGVAPVDGVCSTDIVVIAPQEPEFFGIVLGHFSSVDFVDYTNAGSTGTKMPRTNWHDMARYQIPLPPVRVAKTYTALINPFVARIIANIHESRILASIRDALLPKLLSGELRVEDLERFLKERGL
jgi:type I restriction enzyme S subunit